MPALCYQYTETGVCRFGDRCKFTHSHRSSGGSGLGSGSGNVVCQEFLQYGRCKFGKKCKYPHSRTSQQSRAAETNVVVIPTLSSEQGSAIESPLADFFTDYNNAGFIYDPAEPATSEFYRLCDFMAWDRSNPNRANAHEDFKITLTKQFNANYGVDENELTNWQGLCAALGIEPIPEELEVCRYMVGNTHVNLVDLTDAGSSSREVVIFPTEKALSEYTISSGRYFPREEAYAGGLLKFLLRRIISGGRVRSKGGIGAKRRR